MVVKGEGAPSSAYKLIPELVRRAPLAVPSDEIFIISRRLEVRSGDEIKYGGP